MPEQNKYSMIDNLSSISALRFFGHLFHVHPAIEVRLKQVEKQSANLMSKLLEMRYIDVMDMAERDIALAPFRSRLQQALSDVFGTSSRFWSVYYSRGMDASESLKELDVFFINLDALFHASNGSRLEYEVIEQSYKSYLMGAVYLLQDNPANASDAFQSALKLVGPISAPLWRVHISRAIDNVNHKSYK